MQTQRILPPSADFTEAMSRLATGVVMVTTWHDGRPWGMTVSSFASVSVEPPTILVSLFSDATSARAIEEAGSFGVSILGRHHRAAARRGSTPGGPKFLERFAEPRDDGLNPAMADALAHLECETTEQVRVADHTIFVGLVRDVRVASGGDPLVYFRRAYRTLGASTNPTSRRRKPCLSS